MSRSHQGSRLLLSAISRQFEFSRLHDQMLASAYEAYVDSRSSRDSPSMRCSSTRDERQTE